jgi:hypothetical protein
MACLTRPLLNISSLPPEKRRAIELMYSMLPNYHLFLRCSFTLEDITTTDEKFFTFLSLSTPDLPKGSFWQWNQSRSKQVIEEPGFMRISLCKLNTRKHRNFVGSSPSYKVWVMQIELLQERFLVNFLWCEKGNAILQQPKSSWLAGSGQFFPPELECPEHITLDDLAFLGEFTDRQTAQLLGWLQPEPMVLC